MAQPGRQLRVTQKHHKIFQSNEFCIEQRPTREAKVKRERGGNNEEYTEHQRCRKIKRFLVCLLDCLGLRVAYHETSLYTVPHNYLSLRFEFQPTKSSYACDTCLRQAVGTDDRVFLGSETDNGA